jgi:hypothetical protein
LFFASVPVAFGIIRAVTARGDVRYLWLAAAAIVGSMVVLGLSGKPDGSAAAWILRATMSVTAGALCAAATALLLGGRAGPGVAIVAASFGLCSGASAMLFSLARR